MNAYKMYNLERSDKKEIEDPSETESSKDKKALSLADEMIDDDEVLPAGEKKVPEKAEKTAQLPPAPKTIFESI